MRFLALALPLLLAACASGERQPAARSAPPPEPPQVQQGGLLIGFTATQLAQLFGTPDLRIVEGDGIKQQYRGPCILDAYLYPPVRGREPVVMHVDARGPSGNDVPREDCAAVLQQLR
ncbi:hypothetical protein [Sphingomicrobium clamense]|uniref:Lipoprotein n=1 Tax=Sphingomicrobium clamense TaxID=2851013 RepID=A0ABS6V2C5_9SPHN|nr:hypothetical protein [Sphingomicrobium sp. B8]MBW0143718.1 hypothetical protein [Sphingomicrobium sp. B8]